MGKGNSKQEIIEASLDLFPVQSFEATSISQAERNGKLPVCNVLRPCPLHFENKRFRGDAIFFGLGGGWYDLGVPGKERNL